MKNREDFNGRWCSECGAPMEDGWMTGDGSWYGCTEECLERSMNHDVDMDNDLIGWGSTEDVNSEGGYYHYITKDGGRIDLDLFWTDWCGEFDEGDWEIVRNW